MLHKILRLLGIRYKELKQDKSKATLFEGDQGWILDTEKTVCYIPYDGSPVSVYTKVEVYKVCDDYISTPEGDDEGFAT